MNSIRAFRFAASLLAALGFVAAALAQTATLTTPTAVYSAAGGSVTFNVSIQYSGIPMSSLGLNVALPPGWSYASASGTNVPTIPPADGATEAAEFAYITAPANSAVFSFVLNYAPGGTGSQTIGATLIHKATSAPSQTSVPLPNIVLAPALSALQAVPIKLLTATTAIEPFTPVTGVNGAPAYTFSISPALSTGLTMSPSTGAISGTPAAALANRTYMVTITDTTSATANNTFSITIHAALTSTLAVANKGLTINTAAVPFTPVTIAGGTGFFTYAVSPALPTGLSLDTTTGVISGTPTVTQTVKAHTVTITDFVGAVTSKIFNLTVNAAPVATQAIASRTLTAGTAAVSFIPVTGAGGTGALVYSINPALPANLTMNTSTGAITGAATAAFSTASFTVTVTDTVGASASNTFSLTVNGTVVATQAIAAKVLTAGTLAVPFAPVTASGGTAPYTFTISSPLPSGLTMNAPSGVISGTAGAAATVASRTITITDSVGATATASFNLTVSAALNSTLAVATKSLTIDRAAVAFTPVTITGGTGPFVYSVDPALPTGLTLGATGVITGTPTVTATTANYAILVTDSVGATTTRTLSLTVNPVVVATQAVASRTFTAGTVISTFTPVTGSGGTTPYGFTVNPGLPTGLSMSALNGAVTGNPSVSSGLTTYTVTITDAAGATATATFTVEVNGPVSATLAIASPKLLTAGKSAVAFTPVTAAGGTAPRTFTINPALPSGLSLDNATGIITGTPAAASTGSFTVTVTDSLNATASRAFTLTVNAALVANQAIASRALTVGTLAVPFIPVTGASGTVAYGFAVSPALPNGLSLNATTGQITGTATVDAVATTHTVTITDSVGATASNTFSLTVNVAPSAGATIASRTLTAGALITPFTPLALNGGTLPYNWTVAPALPTGLTLGASNGVISGTPANALIATNYTITGRDVLGAQVTQVLALTINSALIATQAVPSKAVTALAPITPFTPVTASGGTPGYTFAISPGLPASLSFSTSTGAISGTPDAALVATIFTVTITDTVGATASRTFTLTVQGPLTATQAIASKSLTATTLAVSFIPVSGAGGVAPYTYAVSPALPATLLLNANTGAITGTPSAALAATSFTVTVTDTATATATNTFSLTVNPALATTQAIAAKVLTAGAVAVAFTPVTAADGTPPYAFAVSPALPATLGINVATGAITGTPGAALAVRAFTVTATDSVNATSSKTFNLTVNGPPTAVAAQAILSRTLTATRAAVPFIPLVAAGGTPPFTYTVNPALPTGLTLDANTGAISGTADAAAASATYVITATDVSGATVSQNLTLLVNAAPVATAAIPTKALLVNVVATAFTPVTVAGGTAPYVFTISPALTTGLSISASTGAITGTPTVAGNDVTYTVTATDALGAFASNTFALRINRAPAITTPPLPIVGGQNGATVTLTVVANGFPAPTYQWRKDTVAITGNASALTDTLSLTNLQLTDAGAYDVVVTNDVTSITSAVSNVYQIPSIGTPPANASIVTGDDATFSVVAVGTPPLSYEWSRNGARLFTATTSTLTLPAVPLNGGGTISVVVRNPGGSATASATLAVSPLAPAFVAGLAATATAVQDRAFFFPVSINNTTAEFTATGLSGPGGTLAVNAANGSLSGAPANLGTFSIIITATNTAGSASHTLSLTVQAPPPVITSAAATSGRVGTVFGFSVVGTNTPSNYAATGLPAGLSIDAGSGVISGTPTVAGTFTVGLTVTNASGSVSQPLVIVIAPPLNAPVYTGTLTPSGTQGTALSIPPSFGAVTADYSLTGTLPNGLTFSPTTGIISGTPTQTGSFAVTLSATNAGGTTAAQLTIVINAAPAAPVITSASTAPAARVGTAFSFTLTSTGTPAASSYSATPLPAGLTLTGAVISGTPTAFGSFSVSVNASNTVGTGPTSTLSISVAPSASAPVITSAPIAPGQVGEAFAYALTSNPAAATYQITSGSLPAGLSLINATGAIVGTPSAVGQTRVWFNGTASGFSGLSLEVLFTIAPAAATPIVNGNGTATAQVGQPFQYTIAASSGTAITGYGASGRPAWLALNATTGVMSGIPTEATTTPIAISMTATNSGGTGNPKTLLLTVQPAPATPIIISSLSASGRVGTALTYGISASESPTSYVAVGLPPGLLLDPTTGVISGTPTLANSYTVSIRAANAAGLGAPSTLTMTIAPAATAPAITSAASVNAQVGVAFTYQIVATNGPITSYGLSGSAMLPLGLALNTATGAITGRPSDEPRLYVVELTASNAGATSLPQSLSINVAPALGVPGLNTPLYATGTVGVDFSFTITASNLTGSAPYAPPISLDAVNLPPGLAVNPATGVIQGKPTAVGSTIVTLSARNASGVGPMRDLTITIQPALAAPIVTNSGTAPGQVGESFNYQITATNTPTAFEVLGAPIWMTLNGTSGAITGTPTAPGNANVQLVASNAAGSSSPVTVGLSISAASGTPVVTSSRTQEGTVGELLTFTLEVSPAAPAPTFIVTGLPAGLTLNPATREISGTPTVSGEFNVTVTPANTVGVGTPVIILIKIKPSVTFGG